jgi:hypothetical protein
MQHLITNTINVQPKRFQCRHIFTDGRRCGSPCLRGEELCYYHHTTRKPITGTRRRRSRLSAFDLPLPEDRSAIQSSIGQVLQRIASNDIDSRRAGLLLYGLQIASLNLPRDPSSARLTTPAADTVEEIVLDPALGTLAPRSEAGQANSRRSPVAALIDQLTVSQEDEEDHQDLTDTPERPGDEAPALDSILPAVHAAVSLHACSSQPIQSDRSLTSLAMPHQSKRGKILVLLPTSRQKIQPAVPGNLLELRSRLQRSPAKLRRRLCRRLLHKRNQTLQPKVSPSTPRLHHAFGHQKQPRPRLERLHRRLMRQVRKQSQRRRFARQNPRTLRVVKHRRHTSRIHISENSQRNIVATQKGRRKSDSLRSPNQLVIHRLRKPGRRVHHIRARRSQQLRSTPAEDLLDLGRDRLRRSLGTGNIRQQEDHVRAKVDRIEEVATRPNRMILSMQVDTPKLQQLHRSRTSAGRRRTRVRQRHGMLHLFESFRDCNPVRYPLAHRMKALPSTKVPTSARLHSKAAQIHHPLPLLIS